LAAPVNLFFPQAFRGVPEGKNFDKFATIAVGQLRAIFAYAEMCYTLTEIFC
jgi:hypothetical protein